MATKKASSKKKPAVAPAPKPRPAKAAAASKTKPAKGKSAAPAKAAAAKKAPKASPKAAAKPAKKSPTKPSPVKAPAKTKAVEAKPSKAPAKKPLTKPAAKPEAQKAETKAEAKRAAQRASEAPPPVEVESTGKAGKGKPAAKNAPRGNATLPQRDPSKPAVEELYFRSDSAYLCVILNRRTRFIRVVDFRAGALPAKRLYIQSVAKQEGIQKVITLVEKDEVSSWTRVGFVREGTIPGFYKRSDGHLCGCVIGERVASVEVSERDMLDPKPKSAMVQEVEEEEALKERDKLWKVSTGFGAFDAFGRDAARMYYSCSYKKAPVNYISAEYEDCFGHSLVEVLRRPDDHDGLLAVSWALMEMCEVLKDRGIVAGFAFTPSEDVEMASVYLACGFRKTGLLAQGVLVGDTRQDAILWTRKLANPGDDDAATE